MKLWKSSILFVSVAVMLLSSMAVSADKTESDPTGDVWHWNYMDGIYGWDVNVANKPNIDVTEISYAISGSQVTLTMKVAGTITNSETVTYCVYLLSSDSTYYFYWTNNDAIGTGTNSEGSPVDYEPEITANGNTITATYDVIGTFSTGIEFYGYAQELTVVGDTAAEYFQDWVPNEGDPPGGDEDGDGDGDGQQKPPTGTPGFEAIAVIAALGVAFIILRRRNRKN